MMSGQKLYSYDTSSKKVQQEYFFDKHEKYILVAQLVTEGLSQNNLIANVESRKPFLRFLNIHVKNLLFEQGMMEFGRTK